MAEQIVSPGVFTQEKDLTFLPQGIGQIGAAFVGPTTKGKAFIPTIVDSYNDYLKKFGPSNPFTYVPFALRGYLQNGSRATVVRVLGEDGYKLTNPIAIVATGSYGKKLISFLHPTYVVTTDGTSSLFAASTVTANASGSFVLTISGSYTTDTSEFTNATNQNGTAFSSSIDPSSTKWIGDLFGSNPYGKSAVYNYVLYPVLASESMAAYPASTVLIETGSASSWNFTDPYNHASTPWVTSQKIGVTATDLFKFHTISDGVHANHEIKIGITNIKPAGTVAGSVYGQFDVVVRFVDQSNILGSPFTYQDDDIRPNVAEVFTCDLDPSSPRFIQRVIGDRWEDIDTDGRVIFNGDYPNKSAYIRVEVDEAVINGGISSNLVPFGFRAPYSPIPTAFTQPASASYKTAQTAGSVYNKKVYLGFDYDFDTTDNLSYLNPLPVTSVLGTGSNADFYLGNCNQNASANYPNASTPYSGSINLDTTQTGMDARKFMLPLQGGFDGYKPNLQKRTGKYITAANTQGFDISSTSAAGYTAYNNAVTTVTNPDEFDINLIVLPGVIHTLHSSITEVVKELCEDRGDCFYPMDLCELEDNVATAADAPVGFDSNYVGTYYPWVKIVDFDRNKPVWVPPSVVIPAVFAFSDRVAAPWYAPAGLNRGGMTEVIDAKMRLTHADRDTLYEARVNPIATFPGQGVVVWGQKTLQGKPSALDRINVRRLLITAKKFIASTSRYLVFEQNTTQTRQRFLNIANPYFESIQQRQGLYAFKVVMDESNNTPDVIDREQLYGQIYLQPTRTAEFIILDFNLLPTGATFGQ